MGSGVAQALAQSGLSVVLVDIDEAKLEHARGEITNQLRFRALLGAKENLEPAEQVMARLQFTTEHHRLSDVRYVIENATESWEVKRGIYQQIDKICREDCIFMINTSCISITKLAAVTNRAPQVIGTHFMNPVPAKKTVEVIRGYHTSDACVQAVGELFGVMGKEMIVVSDYPGFVSNRISHLFMNEAAYVVQDQVASAEEVDDIFKKCYGHAMGPLETADLIGLDTVVHSLKVLYDSYQDPKFRVCPLLQKMVDAGLHGRKSGEGFYTY
jgi:3-hydroxybutyryl-CoA dehydrogenase